MTSVKNNINKVIEIRILIIYRNTYIKCDLVRNILRDKIGVLPINI